MERDTKKLIKELQERGYKIEKDWGPSIKRTIEVPEALWEVFLKIVEKKDVKIKAEVARMFEEFVEKNREK